MPPCGRADEDPKRRRLTRRITAFRKVGRLYRHRTDVIVSLRNAGFRVHILRPYATGWESFLAKKP